ncbi:hypothetical protein ABPG75_002566 [Micractinium tetrahymenae]
MDEASCRYCWGSGEGPRGLADALVQPCACRGDTAHLHLSCLHTWQLRLMDVGRDPSCCELCRQPYQVPEAAWTALQAAGGVGADERQAVAAWQPGTAALDEPFAALQRLLGAHQQLHSLFDQPNAWAQLLRQRPLRLQALRHIELTLQGVGACEGLTAPLGIPGMDERLAQLQAALVRLHSKVLRIHWKAHALAALRCVFEVGLLLCVSSQLCDRVQHHLAAAAAAGGPAGPLRRLLPDAGTSAAVAGVVLVKERRSWGSWRAVWQRSPMLYKVKRMGCALGALGASLALQRWGPAPLAPLAGALTDVSSVVAAVQVAHHPALCLALGKPVVRAAAALWRLASLAAGGAT